MEQNINLVVEGDLVIETTKIISEYDKEEFLSAKLQELEEHDAGVKAYIEASNEKRTFLLSIIDQLQGESH